jgi:oligoribonuclease
MLIWVDIETTGLDPISDSLLEIAVVITDDKLEEVGSCEYITDAAWCHTLTSLDPFVQTMHTESGLWEESRASNISTDKAAYLIAEFIREYKAAGAQLAGSSVHFDRDFIRYKMPAVYNLAHYRNLDVSSITEVAKRFWPEVWAHRPQPDKASHRAMLDIRDSIKLLHYYLQKIGPVGSI